MHKHEIKPVLSKILQKLSKKDKPAFKIVVKKIEEIIHSYSMDHYKNLRYNMKDSKRVHTGNFFLVFSYDKSKDLISFETFKHHDKIYEKK